MRPASTIAVLLLTACVAAPAVAAPDGPQDSKQTFRVCADPNNLPFSSRDGTGFENRLAELVGAALGKPVAYTWWPQRRGFVRLTLKAGKCDVVMGVPVGYDLVETTRPYYRSTYVFVARADRRLDLHSIKDPRLKSLSIGVQLIGDDGSNTPPVHALSEEGIVDNLVGFTIYGNYADAAPPARIVKAVEDGSVDVAAVWGPLAGYFAQRASVPLEVLPITDTAGFAPLRFDFAIAMGVRKGDHALRRKLDQVIVDKSAEIAALLKSYGVPVVAADRAEANGARDAPGVK